MEEIIVTKVPKDAIRKMNWMDNLWIRYYGELRILSKLTENSNRAINKQPQVNLYFISY